MSAKRKWLIAGFVAVFAVGVFSGAKTVGPPEPEFVKIEGPTKIVHESGPTVYVKTPLDPHCKDALQMANKIAGQADKLYDNGDRQLDISSEYRRVMASSGNTTEVEDKQQALLGIEIGDLSNISDALTEFNTEMKLCKESQ